MVRILYFVVNLLVTTPVLAGSVKAAQWLPWEFISRTWSEQELNLTHHEPQLEINWQDLKPAIKDLHVQVAGQLGKTQFNRTGIETRALDLSATLSIAELRVNQIVKIELNGNVISVRLEARCAPMRISIPRFAVKAQALFVEEPNYWRPELSDLALLIPAGGWSLSPVKCTGLGGLGDLITQRITQALQDPQTLIPLLQEWLAPQVQATWNELWQKLLDATSAHLTLLSMERPSDRGVLFLAELPLNTQREVALPEIREAALSAIHPQLVFSQASLEAMMEDRLLAMIPRAYDLQQIEGFRTLMGSRLIQSFVWPDLRRFSSRTPFYVVARPQDSALSLQPAANGQWSASMKVEGSLQTFISHAIIDYMDWGLNLRTDVDLQVQKSVLTIKTGKPTTKMVSHFSGIYLLLYRPNQKISSSILQDAVQSFFTPVTRTEALPILEWEGRSWKLRDWKQHEDLITMDWVE